MAAGLLLVGLMPVNGAFTAQAATPIAGSGAGPISLSVVVSPADSGPAATLWVGADASLYDLTPSTFLMRIIDVDTNKDFGSWHDWKCLTSYPCEITIDADDLTGTDGRPAAHRFIAKLEQQITDINGTVIYKGIATSSVVTVQPKAWTASLVNPWVIYGSFPSLRATFNQPLTSSSFRPRIIEVGTGLTRPWLCAQEPTCEIEFGRGTLPTPQIGVYRAEIVNYKTTPPSVVVASKNVPVITVRREGPRGPNLALLESAMVLQLEQRAIAALGDQTCLALGEQIRTRALRSSVADTTLVCHAYGLHRALQLLATTAGQVEGIVTAIATLADTADQPAPTNPRPNCDNLSATGRCLDGLTQPTIDPTPTPAAAGAGLPPRKNCMNTATAGILHDSMPLQSHHLASDKNSTWTRQFKEITGPLGLNLTTGVWNILNVRHQGPHPAEYHQWVLDNMKKAETEAKGDPAVFTTLFEAWVKAVVKKDPTITRLSYWKCYR